MMRSQDQDSKALYELSSLVLNLIRSPPAMAPARSVRRLPELTPAGFASMLLGISSAMMLCGSVIFFLGFFLMPWVLGLVMVVYIVGIVSSVSMIWQSVFCGFSFSGVDSIRKEASSDFLGELYRLDIPSTLVSAWFLSLEVLLEIS